jgi:hypothetical protein
LCVLRLHWEAKRSFDITATEVPHDSPPRRQLLHPDAKQLPASPPRCPSVDSDESLLYSSAMVRNSPPGHSLRQASKQIACARNFPVTACDLSNGIGTGFQGIRSHGLSNDWRAAPCPDKAHANCEANCLHVLASKLSDRKLPRIMVRR